MFFKVDEVKMLRYAILLGWELITTTVFFFQSLNGANKAGGPAMLP